MHMETTWYRENDPPRGLLTPSRSRRLGCLGLLAALVAPLACGPAGELAEAEPVGETGGQSSALIVDPDPEGTFGSISHLSPPTAKFTNKKKHSWQLIPGLSGAVHSKAGDNLEIRVSAEMLGGETAYVRAKVDGGPTHYVIFKREGESSDEVRDFTFVKSNVTEGQHIVEIEWWATDDVMIRARTLAIESLPPSMGGVASAVDVLQKTTDTWEDVAGMSTTVTTDATQDFAITFSADSVADSGRLLVRALVDGSKVSDVAFVEAGSGSRLGARSYTFVRKNLPAGAHDVRIQWRVENGAARLGPRTLSVSAGRPTGAAGMDAVSVSLPESTYTSTQFVTVATEPFTTQGPNSSAILSFGAEIKATGRAYVRALVDGVPTSDAPVQLAHGGGSFRVASYQFRATNLGPGYHTVEFQIAAEGGKSATLRKRFHRVLYRPRSGAELVRDYPVGPRGAMPRQRSRHHQDDGVAAASRAREARPAPVRSRRGRASPFGAPRESEARGSPFPWPWLPPRPPSPSPPRLPDFARPSACARRSTPRYRRRSATGERRARPT